MEAVLHGDEEMDLRRGPWTVEEDLILVNYIANHGDGRWNSLARHAGLKRTGKSCRLRWLNYLRPDVRRGNITPEEQLLILELHSRWGNRWSKIAQHLPGRTDNEIKNYWRTRVQKHAKQLQCDVNSKQFKDVMKYLWMPRLIERIRAASSSGVSTATGAAYQSTSTCSNIYNHATSTTKVDMIMLETSKPSPEYCSSSFAGSSSDSFEAPPPLSDVPEVDNSTGVLLGTAGCWPEQCLLSPGGYMEFDQGWSWPGNNNNNNNNTSTGGDHLSDSTNLWNVIGDSWLID